MGLPPRMSPYPLMNNIRITLTHHFYCMMIMPNVQDAFSLTFVKENRYDRLPVGRGRDA
jgi:hypothetical protein